MSTNIAPAPLPADFWRKDLRTLLTEPNPKYTIDTVMSPLRKWRCSCQEREVALPSEDPLCFSSSIYMFKYPDHWNALVKCVIRFHYMAYGVGCDDFLIYQLRAYNVTKAELHAYLHFATKLASLSGLKYLHVDIEAIGLHNHEVMAAFNAA
jgi:hypothetical protein